MKLAAVLGAGIMGGGIAYQSASKGTPILMKDIREEGIQMGLNEASSCSASRVEKGRMTPAKMAEAPTPFARPCPTVTSVPSTSWSKPWSRTRRSSRSCWPKWKAW